MYGLRFLQISLPLPLYEFDSSVPSRAIPVDFIPAPVLKKPKKKAIQEERETYKKLSNDYKITVKFIESIKCFRRKLDEQGFRPWQCWECHSPS